MYDAYAKTMRDHDRILRVLRALAEKVGDAEERTPVAYTLKNIDSVKGRDGRAIGWTGPRSRSTFLKRMRKRVMGAGRKAMGALLGTSSLSGYAQWLERAVDELAEIADKCFLFVTPEGADKLVRAKPSTHLLGDPKGDDETIKEAIRGFVKDFDARPALDASRIRTTGKCEAVMQRALATVGVEKGSPLADEMIQAACGTTGSCLDQEYVRAKDAGGNKEEQAMQVARKLLGFASLRCGEQALEGSGAAIEEALCRSRVTQACKENETICGVGTAGRTLEGIADDLCTEPFDRRRVSECPVQDFVRPKKQKQEDAECINQLAFDKRKEERTCASAVDFRDDDDALCAAGRQAQCLLDGLRGVEGTPAVEECRALANTASIQKLLKEVEAEPVCFQLARLEEQEESPWLRDAAQKVRAQLKCGDGANDLPVFDNGDFWNALGKVTYKPKDKFLPGGLVAPPAMYEKMKNEKEVTSGKELAIATAFVEMQCAGIRDTKQERMLTKRFRELRKTHPDKAEEVLVGREKVFWILKLLEKKPDLSDGGDLLAVQTALGTAARRPAVDAALFSGLVANKSLSLARLFAFAKNVLGTEINKEAENQISEIAKKLGQPEWLRSVVVAMGLPINNASDVTKDLEALDVKDTDLDNLVRVMGIFFRVRGLVAPTDEAVMKVLRDAVGAKLKKRRDEIAVKIAAYRSDLSQLLWKLRNPDEVVVIAMTDANIPNFLKELAFEDGGPKLSTKLQNEWQWAAFVNKGVWLDRRAPESVVNRNVLEMQKRNKGSNSFDVSATQLKSLLMSDALPVERMIVTGVVIGSGLGLAGLGYYFTSGAVIAGRLFNVVQRTKTAMNGALTYIKGALGSKPIQDGLDNREYWNAVYASLKGNETTYDKSVICVTQKQKEWWDARDLPKKDETALFATEVALMNAIVDVYASEPPPELHDGLKLACGDTCTVPEKTAYHEYLPIAVNKSEYTSTVSKILPVFVALDDVGRLRDDSTDRVLFYYTCAYGDDPTADGDAAFLGVEDLVPVA